MPASARLAAAIVKIDAANAADPNREIVDGRAVSKELLYSERMTKWLMSLAPDASEELQIAVRGQHLCRWTIPRNSYPMDRASYLKWRNDCKQMHAEKLGQILCEIGYDSAVTERVKSLVRKERLKADAETQLLEDTACLVFLESYFADFSQEHDEAKLIDIVRKTWKKMSQRGHEAALQIALSPGSQAIVEKAIAGL